MSPSSSKLFVYGSLKPGELAYEQIENYVASTQTAEVRGYSLYVRDGLPLINQSSATETVTGVLLNVIPSAQEEFWEIVGDYEGTTNYKRDDFVTISVSGGDVVGTAYIGMKINEGHPEELQEPWTSKQDPLFGKSFPLMHERSKKTALNFTEAEHDVLGYWDQMNGLLSQYLLLVSIVEHLTVVKFGGSGRLKVMERIEKLQANNGFKASFTVINREPFNPPIKVADSRNVAKSLSSAKVDQALEAWYQVRSNLQHRGKSSVFDAERVHKACIGLSNILFEYLRSNIEGIEDEWTNLLRMRLKLIEFKSERMPGTSTLNVYRFWP